MTTTVTGFDTLAYARRLKGAGADEAHAEAVRDAITEGVATKADIADVRTDIAHLESRLTVRFYGALLAAVAASTGLTVALIKLLP